LLDGKTVFGIENFAKFSRKGLTYACALSTSGVLASAPRANRITQTGNFYDYKLKSHTHGYGVEMAPYFLFIVLRRSHGSCHRSHRFLARGWIDFSEGDGSTR
jgi:hypothetical protein